MGWFIHHVNVQAHDVRQSAAFYRDIIGLKDGAWVYPETVGEVGHNPDSIAAFGSLNRGIHVVRAIPTFPRDNNLLHNPTIGGHFAFNVPDILAVKARLEAAGVYVSVAGEYAMAGVSQIYCYDPSHNVIEINQIMSPAGGPVPGADETNDLRYEAGGLEGDWALHHVNLPAHDVRATATFFQDLIGLEEMAWEPAAGSPVSAYTSDPDSLAMFGHQNRGLHIAKPTPAFAWDNGFKHNPTVGGHFALVVKSLDAVKARMDAAGVVYTEAGPYAMAGMRQLYAYDPSLNLVEIDEMI